MMVQKLWEEQRVPEGKRQFIVLSSEYPLTEAVIIGSVR